MTDHPGTTDGDHGELIALLTADVSAGSGPDATWFRPLRLDDAPIGSGGPGSGSGGRPRDVRPASGHHPPS